jgi:hypothetical protein
VIFVGIDWAEAHHDVCVLDEEGGVLAKGRVPDGREGVGRLHQMVADHPETRPMWWRGSRSTEDSWWGHSWPQGTASTR